ACRGALQTRLEGVSWPIPPGAPNGVPIEPTTAPLPAMTNCVSLEFNPEMSLVPDVGGFGSMPSGLSADVHAPQTGTVTESPARATSAVEATTVKLPAGVLLNPGAANGLGV